MFLENSKNLDDRDLSKVSAPTRWLRNFARDESGAIIALSIFLFLILLMIGGMGIDVMYSEMKRAKMQHTLDRAILAAADLDQTLDPEDVVNSYFEKSGMSDFLSTVTVDEGLNYRVVSASAETSVDTMFMHLVGIDTLSVPSSGTAEERIDGVEVSLILDVSGSMNSNSRLSNLKVAAKDFVETLVDNTDDGKLSISIVPYATQVAVSENLFATLNASINGDVDIATAIDDAETGYDTAGNQQGYSRCIHFESDDFYTTELDPGARMTQAMHFSPWSDFDGRDETPKELVSTPVCRNDSSSEVLALETDETTLKNYIDGLWAGGNTSIDLGMKWGTALLDPSTQGVVDHLIDVEDVSSDFVDRPHFYDDGETLKVVVLMTDGQNTSQYYVNEGFRSGDSNIWWNDEEKVYSVYVGIDEDDYNDNDDYTDDLFYLPDTDAWSDHPYGNGEITTSEWIEHVEEYCKTYHNKGKKKGQCKKWGNKATYEEVISTVSENGEAVQLQYPDLWAYTSLEWNVEDNYEPWMNDSQAWNDWYYDVRDYVGSSTKNDRTLDICQAAKDNNIIVFTIGFEAPSSGVAVLKSCASSDAHYFDVDGLEIQDAFSAIASSIAQLKLTQ